MSKILKVENLSKTYRSGDHDLHVLNQVSFEVNSGEMLVLLKGTPEMVASASLRIEGGIKSTAFPDVSGKEKITCRDYPGDKGKEPGTEDPGDPCREFVPKAVHRITYLNIMKILSHIKRLKVAELRRKSSQG